ncbi:MAG: PepSY domain-containing protein, partial [Clostridiales bacterium]|nr:PepSY domain-containing protein [Clostridiales bacterium]
MTHNKKVLSLILALALMIALFAGCSATSASSEDLVTPKATAKTTSAEDTSDAAEEVSVSQTTTVTTADSTSDLIGETAAKEISLADAGLEEDWVSDIWVKLDTDDDTGVQEYEVEFRESGTEYDYEIDATTGDIISKSTEPVDDDTANIDTTGLIGEDAAKEAALTDAGFAESEVTGLRVQLDTDDGVTIYEVEFCQGGNEYDYDVNATTGAIITKSVEPDDDATTQSIDSTGSSADTSTSSLIGKTAAQEVALEDAGFAESEVTGLTVKQDKENGVTVYEVEFYQGGNEYDYEINATTGAIVTKSVEPDDDATTQSTGSTGSSADTSTSSLIGKTAAQEVALEDAGFAESEVTGLTVKQDKENGVTVYEVEFYQGGNEYDYEINATTGAIVTKSVEPDDDATTQSTGSTSSSGNSTSTSTLIGKTAAQEIALEDAGLTESQVSGLKVKQDKDDGITVYEVEFYTSSAEYE